MTPLRLGNGDQAQGHDGPKTATRKKMRFMG